MLTLRQVIRFLYRLFDVSFVNDMTSSPHFCLSSHHFELFFYFLNVLFTAEMVDCHVNWWSWTVME